MEGFLHVAVISGDDGRAAEVIFVEIMDAGRVDFGDSHSRRTDVFDVLPADGGVKTVSKESPI